MAARKTRKEKRRIDKKMQLEVVQPTLAAVVPSFISANSRRKFDKDSLFSSMTRALELLENSCS